MIIWQSRDWFEEGKSSVQQKPIMLIEKQQTAV